MLHVLYALIILCDYLLIYRYYRGCVHDVTSEEFYVVSFDDGTFCEKLPREDIEVSLQPSVSLSL